MKDYIEIESTLMDALMDGIITVTCEECGMEIQSEPDAETVYCYKCGKIVQVSNPLIENGMI